jgi:hypothetical protein
MDKLLEAKIHNVMSELANEADKSIHDPSIVYVLMHHAVNIFRLTLTHIGYLESKLDSTIESNKLLTQNIENLVAEIQRLSQIAKY